MNRRVVISGCSGGGKSTLISELRRRNCCVVDKPGRLIVREQLDMGGAALPWVDPVGFLWQVLARAKADAAESDDAMMFFDRGMVDAALGLEHLTGVRAETLLVGCPRYDRLVFLAPPWPEIYVTDAERRHGFEDAAAEFERLLTGYRRLGYEIALLPRSSVSTRADFVLSTVGGTSRE